MTQGTTPTHVFGIPFAPDELENVRVTYSQNGRAMISKELKDGELEVGEGCVSVTLTQEETFGFRANAAVEIQVRIKTKEGTVRASDIEQLSVKRSLDKEVM